MSNEFRGTGYVGDQPTIKAVRVADQERSVAELRVYFDERRPDGEGGFREAGGFWLDVNVWGDRRVRDVGTHVRKGARVQVVGRLVEETWTDRDTGQKRSAFRCDADEVLLALSRIESVQYRASRGTEVPEA